MVKTRAPKLNGKEEIHCSFWNFGGEKTEKLNGIRCYGGKNFPDRGNLCCSKAKINDAIEERNGIGW